MIIVCLIKTIIRNITWKKFFILETRWSDFDALCSFDAEGAP